jgi:hypothetical protein
VHSIAARQRDNLVANARASALDRDDAQKCEFVTKRHRREPLAVEACLSVDAAEADAWDQYTNVLAHFVIGDVSCVRSS